MGKFRSHSICAKINCLRVFPLHDASKNEQVGTYALMDERRHRFWYSSKGTTRTVAASLTTGRRFACSKEFSFTKSWNTFRFLTTVIALANVLWLSFKLTSQAGITALLPSSNHTGWLKRKHFFMLNIVSLVMSFGLYSPFHVLKLILRKCRKDQMTMPDWNGAWIFLNIG